MSTGWRTGLRACIACLALWAVGVHATTTCTYFGPLGGQVRLRGTAALEKEVASWVDAPWTRPEVICVFFSQLEPQDSEPWRLPCETDGYAGKLPFLLQTGLRLDQEVGPAPANTGPNPYTRYARPVYAVQNGGGGSVEPASGTLVGKPESVAQCETFPTVIGFFNGVMNLPLEASKSLNRLESEFGTSWGEAPLQYQLFYNQTACGDGVGGKVSCLRDVLEAFVQRDRELGGLLTERTENFWKALRGRQLAGDSLFRRAMNYLGDVASEFVALVTEVLSAVTAKMFALANLLQSPDTELDTQRHIAQLKTIAGNQMGAVLVAHSQGNLFVNAAYDGLKQTEDVAAFRVVHVAPASATLRGDYVLADIDLVIAGLGVTAISTARRPNVQISPDSADALGHSFVETYLDPKREGLKEVRRLIVLSLEAI